MAHPLYRIPTVSRITLNRALDRQFDRLRARGAAAVLDVGAKFSPYRQDLRCERYMTLDIDPATEPDLCCDLHQIEWEDGYFDAVVATQVLEHLHDPQQAVDEIFRIMKPGGICILSVPFIYPYHPDPQDFYRYTQDGLQHLLRRFERVEIYPHGNRIQAIWELIATSKRTLGLLSWLNPAIAKVEQKETRCPLGFVVWAVK